MNKSSQGVGTGGLSFSPAQLPEKWSRRRASLSLRTAAVYGDELSSPPARLRRKTSSPPLLRSRKTPPPTPEAAPSRRRRGSPVDLSRGRRESTGSPWISSGGGETRDKGQGRNGERERQAASPGWNRYAYPKRRGTRRVAMSVGSKSCGRRE